MIHWIKNGGFHLKLDLSAGMAASVELPPTGLENRVWMDGKEVSSIQKWAWLVLEQPVAGSREFVVK